MTELILPPLKIPVRTDVAPWYCESKGSGDGECNTTKDTFRVKYKAGAVGSESGITLHAAPPSIFPSEDVELSYQVFFHKPWDWREGGKLIGLYLGDGASGGDWNRDGGSVRVIFKEGGKGCGYVYIPLQVARRDDMEDVQPREYRDIVSHTAKGDHLWRDGVNTFKVGSWNDVRLRVRLNAPGRADGTVELEINGVAKSLPLIFRRKEDILITSLCWSTFFGGSSREARAPQNAIAEFRKVRLVNRQRKAGDEMNEKNSKLCCYVR